MVDQPTVPGNAGNGQQPVKCARRRPILACALILVYLALFAVMNYEKSLGIEDYWPAWVLWVASVIWFAIMMVLPFVIVKLFGIDLSPLRQLLPRRFTLRRMLLWTVYASLLCWYVTQIHWRIQRGLWRGAHPAAARPAQGPAPASLRLLGESGESRIELLNATDEEVAEARRLFPEAVVVVTSANSTNTPSIEANK